MDKIFKKEIDKIYKKYKNLTAELIVKEASNQNHPLHKYFEWDDSIAGHLYRLTRARVMINAIIIISPITNNEIAEYEILTNEDGNKSYKPYYEIKNNNFFIQQVVEQCYKWLENFQKKLSEYKQLKTVAIKLKPVLLELEKIKKKNGKKTTRKGN